MNITYLLKFSVASLPLTLLFLSLAACFSSAPADTATNGKMTTFNPTPQPELTVAQSPEIYHLKLGASVEDVRRNYSYVNLAFGAFGEQSGFISKESYDAESKEMPGEVKEIYFVLVGNKIMRLNVIYNDSVKPQQIASFVGKELNLPDNWSGKKIQRDGFIIYAGEAGATGGASLVLEDNDWEAFLEKGNDEYQKNPAASRTKAVDRLKEDIEKKRQSSPPN